jgi:hypothetical protein
MNVLSLQNRWKVAKRSNRCGDVKRYENFLSSRNGAKLKNGMKA